MSKSGRVDKERDVRDVWNGVPSDTIDAGRWSGYYQRTDTTIVVHLTDELGTTQYAYTYRISDEGRVLRGLEGDLAQRTYVYTRE